MFVAWPRRQPSTRAHGDRDQRTVAHPHVGAAAEARLPVAGGVLPRLLERRPAGESEGRVGLHGLIYAAQGERAWFARGGCIAPVTWWTA